MLMTEPGGTGKTHAVRVLQELMKLHNSQHLICFLGPMGRSVKQIGEMMLSRWSIFYILHGYSSITFIGEERVCCEMGERRRVIFFSIGYMMGIYTTGIY